MVIQPQDLDHVTLDRGDDVEAIRVSKTARKAFGNFVIGEFEPHIENIASGCREAPRIG